jgi:hypothetical protein
MKLNGEEIQNLYLSGLSTVTIAQNYGVSKVAILYHLHKLKTPMRHPPTIPEPIICELYISGKSTVEIGREWNVSAQCIKIILERNGISRRSKKEALEKYSKHSICVVCGKDFRVRSGWKDGGSLSRKTCSENCLHLLLHDIQINHNSNIKKGDSQGRYQRIRRELKPDVCELCGAVPPVRMDSHHKDRNKSNNTKENLMVLCVHCHAHLHYLEDDRGLRGRKPNQPLPLLP